MIRTNVDQRTGTAQETSVSRPGTTRASDNARNIRALLDAGTGYADLYRTVEAGPSGQRTNLLVGRVRIPVDGPYDFAVIDLTTGARAGFALREFGRSCPWSITAESRDGALSWLGRASSLAVGVDVLIWGEQAALGRHDRRRISSGRFERNPLLGTWP
jgi:hypothetical protein